MKWIKRYFSFLGTPNWYQGIDKPTFIQRITWRCSPFLAWDLVKILRRNK